MDEKRHDELRDYLRWMANEMGLRDWTITLSREHPDKEDAIASVECVHGRKWLIVRLKRGFEHRTLEEQRHDFVHELIHAHLCGIRWGYNNLGDEVSSGVFNAVWGAINDALEYATDGLADVIAPHMPLPTPKKPKKKRKTAL